MRFPAKATKYRAVRTEYKGEMYDSRAEAKRAAELDLLKLAGKVTKITRQPTFRLGCPENVYRPDFKVSAPEGEWAEDVKGFETAKFKRDRKLWKSYGEFPLHIIKGNKIEIIIPKHLEQQP